jgi:hypothetical protein
MTVLNNNDMTTQQKKIYQAIRHVDDSRCWIWQGQVSNSGYGRVHEVQSDRSLKMVSAQSASYRAFIAEIPDGKLVKQRCGNRLCVNPEHLDLIEV